MGHRRTVLCRKAALRTAPRSGAGDTGGRTRRATRQLRAGGGQIAAETNREGGRSACPTLIGSGWPWARSFQPQPSVALMGSSSDFYEERPGFERVSGEIGVALTAPQFCIGAQGKAQPDLGRLLSDLGFQ